MPTNKNAFIRLLALDKLLSTKSGYTFNQLLERVNERLIEMGITPIQRRQLYNDLANMESFFGALIHKEKYGRGYRYRYEDPNFSIRWGMMGSAIDQIDKLFSTLTHLYGPATDDDARKIIADFLAKIRHVKPNISPYIFLDHNEYVNGLEHLDELLNAILNRRVLKITYQSFHSPAPVEIIYHPYVIRQYNYRWFVIGRNEQENHNRWVLGLDRIKNIEEENSIQYVNSPVQNWKEHFEELIGVTWPDGEKPKTVELIFTQDAAPRVITKPIHPTQKQKRLPDGRLKVTIQVVLNKELENLILSFGEQVCVESPDELRNSIVQRLSGAYRCYQS